MKYILRAVPVKERMDNVVRIYKELPTVMVLVDERRMFEPPMRLTPTQRCGMAFFRAFQVQNEDAAVHLEDDVQLCRNFRKKIERAIEERPNEVIQFFSMRKQDKTIGSRYSRKFVMGQCFYLPKGYGTLLANFMVNSSTRLVGMCELEDLVINEFLKSRKERFWIHCPSLVQHLPMKSISNPRRSTKRQSATFQP